MRRERALTHPRRGAARLSRRASWRRVCLLLGAAFLASVIGGPALADTPSQPTFRYTPASSAALTTDVAADASTVPSPGAQQTTGLDGSASAAEAAPDGERGPTPATPEPDARPGPKADGEVVDELAQKLSDPIVLVAGPSASHGLSMQEGDSRYPVPFDGAVDTGTKAVLPGGSRSTKSKDAAATPSGDQPHWPVNQLCSLRVNHAYGAANTAPADNGAAMRGGCTSGKVLSQQSASRSVSTSTGAGDATTESAADAGEDDLAGNPAMRPDNVVFGRVLSWEVPAAGTVVTALQAVPDDPSFSPD